MSTTTTDNLTKATTALSLSPSAASFDFSKPFTLVSADGHSFSVDPLKLAGTSSVFADMLSSGGGDRTCTLSEKKEEIEQYLETVENGTCSGEAFDAVSLLRMADKYDAPIARSAAVGRGWTAIRRSNPGYPYAVGKLLGNKDMARYGAAALLLPGSKEADESRLYKTLDSADKALLEKYRLQILEVSRHCILDVPLPTPSCLHPATANTVTFIWTLATHRATGRLKPSDEPDKVIREELYKIRHSRPSCLTCINLLDEAAHKVGENWASPNKGKKSVKLFD